MPENQKNKPATPRISTPKKAAIKKVSLKINGEHEGKKEDEAAGLAPADKPASAFTHEEFMKCWKELSAKYKAKSHSLYMALTQHHPKIKNDNTILLYLDNAIQQDLIRENLTGILSFLHKGLNNYHLGIETEISLKQTKKKAYLPKEKLDELIRKNPDIKLLKDELGLDLDYS